MAVWGGSVGRLVAGWRGISAIAIALGALLVTVIATFDGGRPDADALRDRGRVLQPRLGGLRGDGARSHDPPLPGERPGELPALPAGRRLPGRGSGGHRWPGGAAEPRRRLGGRGRGRGRLHPLAEVGPEQGAGGLGRPARAGASERRRRCDSLQLRPRLGVCRLPRGGAERERHAEPRRDLVRRGQGPARRPHALDELRVPRRQLPLRTAVVAVRNPGSAAGLLEHRGPAGAAAPMQNFLNYGNPVAPHDTSGWPKLTAWARTNLTYDGVYWRWVQRDWMAGERLMVMPVNENRVLCQLQANRKTDCDEMATGAAGDRRRLQAPELRRRAGRRPWQGLLPDRHRPVRGPARDQRGQDGRGPGGRDLRALRLSRLESTSTCSQAQIDSRLRTSTTAACAHRCCSTSSTTPLPACGSTAARSALLINDGNKESSGSFWSAETCTGSRA